VGAVETFLAWLVVVLLVGPPTLVVLGELVLLGAGLAPGRSRRLRERFECPWSHRVVTADFLVPEGAAHPTDVLACTAFRNSGEVRCRKACRALADVQWGLPRGVFPRWALTADGVVTWRTPTEAAPVPSR
jgi:hypothetical protein